MLHTIQTNAQNTSTVRCWKSQRTELELKYVVRAAKDYEEEAISNPDNIFLLLNWSEKEEITVYDGKQKLVVMDSFRLLNQSGGAYISFRLLYK